MTQLQDSNLHVVFLVDTSTSMERNISLIQNRLVDIKNAVLATGIPVKFGVASFADHYCPLDYTSVSIPFNGGSTALYNSCIRLIQDMTRDFTAANKVLIIVITDGEDTEGKYNNTTPQHVAQEVSIAEDILGWDFLFLGTNINAYKVGSAMGVKTSKTLSFANSNDGFKTMLDGLADVACKWVTGNVGHNDTFFTSEVRSEQERLGGIKFVD